MKNQTILQVLSITTIALGLILLVLAAAPIVPPAPSVPGAWSIEFEELCYEYDVDGTIYERRVRPTFHTTEANLSSALIFALQTYQLEFDQNGPFGESAKVTLCSSPPAPAVPVRVVGDVEPFVTGTHPLPKVR